LSNNPTSNSSPVIINNNRRKRGITDLTDFDDFEI
jgi:hypothetical protein